MKKMVFQRSICIAVMFAFNISGLAYADQSLGGLDTLRDAVQTNQGAGYDDTQGGVNQQLEDRSLSLDAKSAEPRSGSHIAAAIGVDTPEPEVDTGAAPKQQPAVQPTVPPAVQPTVPAVVPSAAEKRGEAQGVVSGVEQAPSPPEVAKQGAAGISNTAIVIGIAVAAALAALGGGGGGGSSATQH